jgi:hypothetical protein
LLIATPCCSWALNGPFPDKLDTGVHSSPAGCMPSVAYAISLGADVGGLGSAAIEKLVPMVCAKLILFDITSCERSDTFGSSLVYFFNFRCDGVTANLG